MSSSYKIVKANNHINLMYHHSGEHYTYEYSLILQLFKNGKPNGKFYEITSKAVRRRIKLIYDYYKKFPEELI